MATWPGVLNQVIRDPGDVDDCWVMATIWAARASDRDLVIPSIKTFRGAAGDPDDGYRDGGNLSEIILGCSRLWPELAVTAYDGRWAPFAELIRQGRPASLAVISGRLPYRLRFGFTGAHQIGVAWDGSSFVVANPLAPEGSAPQRIPEADLRTAAEAMGAVRAAIFPAPILRTRAYRAGVRAGRLFWPYTRDRRGGWSRPLLPKLTRGGFSGAATRRAWFPVLGRPRQMTQLMSGAYAGTWLDVSEATPATATFYREE